MEVRGQKSDGLRRFWQLILFIWFLFGMTIKVIKTVRHADAYLRAYILANQI